MFLLAHDVYLSIDVYLFLKYRPNLSKDYKLFEEGSSALDFTVFSIILTHKETQGFCLIMILDDISSGFFSLLICFVSISAELVKLLQT